MKMVLKALTLLLIGLLVGCPEATGGGGRTPEPEVYTVTFDGNGGDVKTFNDSNELVEVTSIEVESGKTLGSLPLSLQANYAFLGWTDASGAEFTRKTVVTKDITLTAKLELATENLVYTDNGDGTASVGDNTSFEGSEAKIASYVTIGASTLPVTTIGEKAFFIDYHALQDGILETVIISNSIITIERSAFGGRGSFESIIIPDSVETIGTLVFSYCGGLTSVTIGDSVKTIETSAFQNCINLENVYTNYTKANYPSTWSSTDNNYFFDATWNLIP